MAINSNRVRLGTAALAVLSMIFVPLSVSYADPEPPPGEPGAPGAPPAAPSCPEQPTKTVTVTITYTPPVPVLTDIPGISSTLRPSRPSL